ncbi:hypothetical protein CDV55_101585 [Aspergillus turcosus]|nr:hypothetical protein CDV55_101585 [Aspergillus turcosus]
MVPYEEELNNGGLQQLNEQVQDFGNVPFSKLVTRNRIILLQYTLLPRFIVPLHTIGSIEVQFADSTSYLQPQTDKEDCFLGGLISQHAQTRPQHPDVRGWDGALTYEELNNDTSRVASPLQAECGVKPGMLVLVCFERSMCATVAELPVLKAGANFVPIDPTQSDLSQTLLISPDSISTSGHEVNGKRSCMDASTRYERDAPAYVFLTSGSTGQPKGWALLTPSTVNTIYPEALTTLQTLVLKGQALANQHLQRWATRLQLLQGYELTDWAGIPQTIPCRRSLARSRNSSSPEAPWRMAISMTRIELRQSLLDPYIRSSVKSWEATMTWYTKHAIQSNVKIRGKRVQLNEVEQYVQQRCVESDRIIPEDPDMVAPADDNRPEVDQEAPQFAAASTVFRVKAAQIKKELGASLLEYMIQGCSFRSELFP